MFDSFGDSHVAIIFASAFILNLLGVGALVLLRRKKW